MPAQGLTPTDQLPASAIATETVDNRPVSELWESLLSNPDVRSAIIEAIRDGARGQTPLGFSNSLRERDVPPEVEGSAVNVARGDKKRALELAVNIIPNMGAGWATIDDLLSVASLFGDLENTKTIAFRLNRGAFETLRRDQRENVCALLAQLSRGLDVRLVLSRVDRAWISHEHRSDLPGVSEWCNTTPDDGPLSEQITTALRELDRDSTQYRILEALSDTPSGSLSYHEIYAETEVGTARARQCVGDLQDLNLVDVYGPQSDRRVDLLTAGAKVIETLEGETTVQRRLDECVSDTPQSSTQCRVTPAEQESPHRNGPYRTEYLNRPNHAAAVASAVDGGVGLVKHPVDRDKEADETRIRYVSYDPEHDEAVVAVRATGPLQYGVSVATALASPEFVDRALPSTRLSDLGVDAGTLRGRRNIGVASDEALSDPETLRDKIVEWGRQIEDMTTRLENDDYEDRDELRSNILASSHGLAGSVAHLLDLASVDLFCEVRVPGGLDRSKDLRPLAKSLSISAGIQSAYGHYAPYRHLYETEAGAPPMEPLVDADDPLGSLITGFAVRGPDVHRFGEELESHLQSPTEERDEAPEIGVEAHIEQVGRDAFAAATSRILSEKNLRPTRDVVSLLHALCGAPHDVARALYQLESEPTARTVRTDELRYALATVPHHRLLPNLPPSVGSILAALLKTTGRVSKSNLAEIADVSTESIRRHQDALEGLGLISSDGGYRLELSFQTPEEREAQVAPNTLGGEFVEVADALLSSILPPERYGDPEDPVGGALFWPPDPWELADHSEVGSWVRIAAALSSGEIETNSRTVRMGPTLPQTPLPNQTAAA